MPFRAKLFLGSLFLLLLGWSIVYVAITWGSAEPLRFKVVRKEALPEQEGIQEHRLHVEVCNTSSVPVIFRSVFLYRDIPSGDLIQYDPPLTKVGEEVLLLPNACWSRTASVSFHTTDTSDLETVRVDYHHTSGTKQLVVGWYETFWRLLPRSLRGSTYVPIYRETDAFLDFGP